MADQEHFFRQADLAFPRAEEGDFNGVQGNIEQANHEAQSAAEIREALHILKAVMAARNWPVYHTQVPLPNNPVRNAGGTISNHET